MTQYEAISFLPSGYSGAAMGISDSGYIVGSCSDTVTGYGQAFIWDKTGGFRSLKVAGSQDSIPFAVNNAGQVVGQWHDAHNISHAAYWEANGTFHDLGLGGFVDINNSGMAVGWVGQGGMWNMNGTPKLAVPLSANPHCINDIGQVGGDTYVSGAGEQAFVWDATGGVRRLDTGFRGDSTAWDISDLGWAAGYRKPFFGESSPCLWKPDGSITMLGLLDGAYGGWAKGTNDSGVVVGGCNYYSGHSEAFVWTAQDGLRALSALGGNSSYADAVNSAGQIVGYDGSRAVLWNPVPEPCAWAAVLSGIVGLGFLSASRRRVVSRVRGESPEELA